MKTLLILGFLNLYSVAQARTIYTDDYYEINQRIFIQYQTDCVAEYMTLLSEHERVAKQCSVQKPLRLSWTTQRYPNLDQNPRRVQYWEGEVLGTRATDRTFLRELVDECRGRVISKQMLRDVVYNDQAYDVTNPNLDTEINETFMLSPMTYAEAKSELAEAFARCSEK